MWLTQSGEFAKELANSPERMTNDKSPNPNGGDSIPSIIREGVRE
jgi:hypothetical protein